MKKVILLFCLLTLSLIVSCADSVRFWEQYSEAEKSGLLKSGAIETSVVGIYNGSFAIGDNVETFKLLDLLSDYKYGCSQANAIVDAFYIHCFSKILRMSDGALSEVMGEYCIRIVKKSPEYTISYLKSHQEIRDAFVIHIGYEVLCSDSPDIIYESLMKCMKVDSSFAEDFVSAVKNWVGRNER